MLVKFSDMSGIAYFRVMLKSDRKAALKKEIMHSGEISAKQRICFFFLQVEAVTRALFLLNTPEHTGAAMGAAIPG